MSFKITNHPILKFEEKRQVSFYFGGQKLFGDEGLPVLAALRANGVVKLREGAKNHTPFGPFCLQGRCCSCNMTVDGRPNTMTCVTPLKEGMRVDFQDLEKDAQIYKQSVEKSDLKKGQDHLQYDLAIIGAGPAGLEAALKAYEAGCRSIALFDDKAYLGGQLVLQTHAFFGNEELGAGVRGFEIARQMEGEIKKYPEIKTYLNATVVGFYPRNILAFKDKGDLNFIQAKKVVVATGASERFIAFEGNTLPGVMGAGGAQTLMNVYGVRPGKRVLVVGGGNIGVILAYQLIQANIEVVAVIEGSSKMGAYGVHVNKLKALGVPILTEHTILKAQGSDLVTGAMIARVDSQFRPIAGTEKTYQVDTICLAVGLSPLNELLWQAGVDFHFSPELGEVPRFDKRRKTSHPDIFVAGDCAVIGEASIARLEGRIAGMSAAYELGFVHENFQKEMDHALTLLTSIQSGTFGRRLEVGKDKVMGEAIPEDVICSKKATQTFDLSSIQGKEKKIIIRCEQDIPCNPCEASCHLKAITIGAQLTQTPDVDFEICKGCGLCLPKCPGRAINVLQYNYSDEQSALTIPFEFEPFPKVGDEVPVLNKEGAVLTVGKVVAVRLPKAKEGDCGTVTFAVNKNYALEARAIEVSVDKECAFKDHPLYDSAKATYVCRCEEVTLEDVEQLLEKGHLTLHEVRRLKRIGMGACQGQSCSSVMQRLFSQKNVSAKDVVGQKQKRSSIFRPPSKRLTLGEAARLTLTKEELALWHTIEQERTLPMELVSSYSERAFTLSPATPSRRKKIVIIGGGISGVMTAWWLARMGESDVVVIESDFLTAGKTGACLGGIRTGFNTKNKILRAKKGLEVFRDAFSLIGKEVGWHQGGYVYLAFDAKQDALFEFPLQEWERTGVAFSYTRNKNEFSRYVPGLNAQDVVSLVFFPEAGGANPFQAVFYFAEDAKKRGVEFLSHHEAVSIEKSGNKVSAVSIFNKEDQSYHSIQCDTVVNCGGTSAIKIAKMVGIDISDQVWVESHGAFVTEKMPMWLDALIVSYHPTLSGYWQQKHMEPGLKEGELVACYTPDPIIKGFNKAASLPFLSRMAQSILHCCPGLEDLGIVRSFAEHYVGRASGIPMIGPTPVQGFWMNVAKKGHGFMCGPGDAFALASSILEGNVHEWISECTLETQGNLKETMK